jgi:hypothetical protein
MHRLLSFFAKPQISLRSGMALFIGLCIGFGGAGRWLHSVRSQAEAQRRLFQRDQNQNGGEGMQVFVAYAHEKQTPVFRQWCRTWIHSGAQQRIDALGIFGERLDAVDVAEDVADAYEIESAQVIGGFLSARMSKGLFRAPGMKRLHLNVEVFEDGSGGSAIAELAQARRLEDLIFKSPRLGLPEARVISGLPKLTSLSVHACEPESLGELGRCTSLKQLQISEVLTPNDWEGQVAQDRIANELQFSKRMTSALEQLAGCGSLESLDLCGLFVVNPYDLHSFCSRTKIKSLRLDDCVIAVGMLEEIALMPELDTLQIGERCKVEGDLLSLTTASKLKRLHLEVAISKLELKALRTALPRCKIYRAE